jgi:hypothetical protein
MTRIKPMQTAPTKAAPISHHQLCTMASHVVVALCCCDSVISESLRSKVAAPTDFALMARGCYPDERETFLRSVVARELNARVHGFDMRESCIVPGDPWYLGPGSPCRSNPSPFLLHDAVGGELLRLKEYG